MREVTGLGSTHIYRFDMNSRKVLSRDGQKDAFVDFYEEKATDDQLSTLNGWDWTSRGMIKGMANDLLDGEFRILSSFHVDPDIQEIDIRFDINDEGDYRMTLNNGKGEEFTCGLKTGILMYRRDLDKYGNGFQTTIHKDYDPSDNSINMAIGDSYSSGKYSIEIHNDRAYGKGATSKEEEDELQFQLTALTHLIDFADQQVGSGWIDEDKTPFLLAFLRRLEVDVTREFTVNKTRCHVVDGRIREVGNVTGTPLSIYKEAFERHVNHKNIPLTKNAL